MLPLDGKRLDYVGIGYVIFFPVVALLMIGALGSLASLRISGRDQKGLIWPVACLVANLYPFVTYAWNAVRVVLERK